MKKFNYLIKSGANLNTISSYLIYSITSRFNKKKKKNFIQNYKNFLIKKKITHDFFSRNIFDWIDILQDHKTNEFEYLEIGSFEGNSAMFVLENFKNCFLTCVDSWEQLKLNSDSKEGYEHLPIIDIEDNFDDNLRIYSERYKKEKILSDLFFRKNNKFFDVVFIDGSHFADNVFKDCKNSWPILKKNGILILDDYFWKGYEKPEQNPAFAINKFLKEINGEYKIIKLTKFQLFLRKLS